MMVNVPLLRKSVEWVEEQEQLDLAEREWRQEWWMSRKVDGEWQNANFVDVNDSEGCDTAYCIAGKVVVDHGWEFIDHNLAAKDGTERLVECLAAEILGIEAEFDETGGCPLFHPFNDAADIRRLAESYAGEEL